MAEDALKKKCRLDVRIEIIRTSGDREMSRGPDGRKGIFTHELELALLDKRIGVAVHSAKDLPSKMNDALTIAAVLSRDAVEDVLITKRPNVTSFATIATGSVRRQHQARWLKKPQTIVDLRGNVPTRLRKFADRDWDAIILARAGLERLGFSGTEFEFEQQKFFARILPVERFVPAGGQGVIALQTRAEDAPKYSAIDHRETHLCLRAERELLRLLQGDCDLPVGTHARYVEGEIELLAQLFQDEEAPKMASVRGKNPEKLAKDVFRRIEHEHDYEHERE